VLQNRIWIIDISSTWRVSEGLRTNNLPTTASVLQISTSVFATPPTSFMGYNDVSCSTFSSSAISNEESNNPNNEDISGGQRIGNTIGLIKATSLVATKYIEIQNSAKSGGTNVIRNTLNNVS
jgi:hypothetical protein